MADGKYFHVHERGTIGNVTYRWVNGKLIASNKSSLTGDRVRTAPEFENTQKVMNEFKGTALATKMLMDSLNGLHVTVPGAKRLMRRNISSRMSKIQKSDTTGAYGHRGIYVSQNPELLTNITWGTYSPSASLQPEPTIEAGEGKQVTMTIGKLEPGCIQAPQSTTHTKLMLMMYAVSDYVYNEDTHLYEAVNADAEKWSAMAETDYLSHTEAVTVPITLTVKPDLASTEGAAFFAAYGIAHYQKSGEGYVMMREKYAWKTVMAV